MTTLEQTQATSEEDAPQPIAAHISLGLPLLVTEMEATIVEKPGTHERMYAYNVTLKAVLPESELRFFVDFLEDHTIKVSLQKNDLKGQ